MKILAIDTTTPRGSAAISEGSEVLGEVRFTVTDSRHSSHALPAAEFLLKTAGWASDSVEAFAVTTGPGSFTGLRVGLSTVQGLALGSGRPCLGVSSLDVLAGRITGTAETLVALVDARRGEIYAGLYDREGRSLGEPRLGEPAAVLGDLPPAAAYIGDGALLYREQIVALHPGSSFPQRSLFLAGALARIAAARFAAGDTGRADALRPTYLRGADGRPSGS